MTAPQVSRRHHYVPQFYLRQWAGVDGMLWQYKRERSGKLSEDPKSPKATSFQEDLYSVQDVSWWMTQREPDVIETKFLAKIDGEAKKVLEKFLSPALPPLSDDDRTAWALFLNSLLERDPRVLHELEQVAPTLHSRVLDDLRAKCEDEESRERLENIFRKLDHAAMARNSVREQMVSAIRRKDVIDYFKSLLWTVVSRHGEPALIATDAPVLLNCGRERRPIHIISLPLSPDKLLVMYPREWHKDFEEGFFDHLMILHNFLLIQGDPEYLYSRDRIEDWPTVRFRLAVESSFGRPRPTT